MARILITSLFLINAAFLFSQAIISGTVIDEKNNILPFVNIGIKNKNVGALSGIDGIFSLSLPKQFENDSLTFSMVGYEQLTLSIKNIKSAGQASFKLNSKVIQLKDVLVTAKKLSEKKYGIVKYNPLFHFIDASQNKHDIFEIAQLLHLGKSPSKVTSLNLFVNETVNDSATFRVNFYQYKDGFPSGRAVEKSIVQTHAIKEGWLRFDLAQYNIYLSGEIVIALEFLPLAKKSNEIKYDVKLGGRTKSFVRSSSQGTWQVPPHHYRLFITALSGFDNSAVSDNEEHETPPTKIFFSKSVDDTFFIFVGLPKNYKKRSGQTHSVIYLLDGNVYFDAVYGLIKESPSKEDRILVGIGYKNAFIADSLRDRDYSHPQVLATKGFPVSGGANKFIGFIKEELIPYIDKNYATNGADRTIMGHSLGGYFTLYMLKCELNSQTPAFINFISLSPSLDYSDEYLTKQFSNNVVSGSISRCKVYLAIGEYENINQLEEFAKILTEKKINVKSEVFPKYGHMETVIPGFKNGLESNQR